MTLTYNKIIAEPELEMKSPEILWMNEGLYCGFESDRSILHFEQAVSRKPVLESGAFAF